MTASTRRGFTLIEILIACILLGVGLTSVIALLLGALRLSREVTAMTTMGPVATAAASLCAIHNAVPAAGAHLDLPDTSATPVFYFESPYALRVDRALPADSPVSADDDASLVTLRVRVYDSPDHRDLDARCLGTLFIRQYLRPRP